MFPIPNRSPVGLIRYSDRLLARIIHDNIDKNGLRVV